jgi:hypothetical protein
MRWANSLTGSARRRFDEFAGRSNTGEPTMKFVTTGLAVGAMVVALGGAAFAQSGKIGTDTRGAAGAAAGSGINGGASGSTKSRIGVQAPGANVGVGVGASGQGSARTKGGTIGAGAGANGKARGGVSSGR